MIKTVIKGDILHTPTKDSFEIHEDSYVILENGFVKKITKELEEVYKEYDFYDYTGKLVIPGFNDIHLHAPQYPNRGLGLDYELIPWLNKYTFPEESKYSDLEYAEKIYKMLINELWTVGTTRSAVYSTAYLNSSKLLMDLFIESGLGAYVGKVNMDRNTAPALEEDTKASLEETEELLKEYIDKSELVKPIITPRFIPTCTDELLTGLGELALKYDAPIQSHLSENTGEIEWVKQLHPDSKDYASAYDKFGLFGQTKTIMAHCVHNTDDEIKLMAENGVYVAHCPYSNYNLSSGIAPIRKYMNENVKIGLASDISGGHTLNMAQVIVGTIQASKMVWQGRDKSLSPVRLSEAFHLATKGGGSFFGKVGSFEEGYEFDALVIDVEDLQVSRPLTIEEKFEKFIYLGTDKNIIARYVRGKLIEKPF